ncbi:MAG: hypothetical protein ACTS85_01215 [Arsenophonus sp. NC-PG7-MAG3]
MLTTPKFSLNILDPFLTYQILNFLFGDNGIKYFDNFPNYSMITQIVGILYQQKITSVIFFNI